MIHLDNNATTRPCEQAIAAATDALARAWHNPSSPHRAGQEARALVELARRDVARLLGANPREIVFTSGATEAINLAIPSAIRGALRPARDAPPAVVVGATEHEAVHACVESLAREGRAEVRVAPVDSDGALDLDAFASLLEGASLACVQWVNGETGALQPVDRIGAICRERNIPYFCDATQRAGRAPIDLAQLPIDMLCCAAHKMHGVKGAGALAVRQTIRLHPTQPGAQELERRGGTEAVPAIAAFGAAARAAMNWLADEPARDRQRALRDRLEGAALDAAAGAHVNGARRERIWCTSSVTLPSIDAEPFLLSLSEAGVLASAGPACASGSLEPSRTLRAMGLSEESALRSIRLSVSRETTPEEIDQAAQVLTAKLSAAGKATA